VGGDRLRHLLEPIAGLVALGVWQLQPLVGFVGNALRRADVLAVTLLRFPIELVLLARTIFGRAPRSWALQPRTTIS